MSSNVFFFPANGKFALLWAGSHATGVKIKTTGQHERLNECVIICSLFIYVIDKRGRGPIHTTWRAAGWTPMAYMAIRLICNWRCSIRMWNLPVGILHILRRLSRQIFPVIRKLHYTPRTPLYVKYLL